MSIALASCGVLLIEPQQMSLARIARHCWAVLCHQNPASATRLTSACKVRPRYLTSSMARMSDGLLGCPAFGRSGRWCGAATA